MYEPLKKIDKAKKILLFLGSDSDLLDIVHVLRLQIQYKGERACFHGRPRQEDGLGFIDVLELLDECFAKAGLDVATSEEHHRAFGNAFTCSLTAEDE